MIVYCVKTDEYLRTVLEKVSFGAEYYCQFDVPSNKVLDLIKKLNERYKLDQTARQRTYALKKKPVLDLVVGQTMSLFKASKVRLCLCCTMPLDLRNTEINVNQILKDSYDLSKADKEKFFSFSDRKNRFNFYSVVSPTAEEKNKTDEIPVYTLLQLPYTAKERKQKGMTKTISWTYSLHKKFVQLKTEQIHRAFKKNQKVKNRVLQDKSIELEIAKLARLSGFRGVRDDVFKINSMIQPSYFRYFNRECPLDLKIPMYEIKKKYLVKDYQGFINFPRNLN